VDETGSGSFSLEELEELVQYILSKMNGLGPPYLTGFTGQRCFEEKVMIGAIAGHIIGCVYEWRSIRTIEFEPLAVRSLA
jgi:hypothetical protein